MKYAFNGIEYNELPKKLTLEDGSSVSPVSEALFIELGGTISEELTPKEKVIDSLNTLLQELSTQVQGISIADFKTAASTLHSGELVGYARQAGVSEELINAARIRIVEILADAMREGMTWNELIDGILIPETE